MEVFGWREGAREEVGGGVGDGEAPVAFPAEGVVVEGLGVWEWLAGRSSGCYRGAGGGLGELRRWEVGNVRLNTILELLLGFCIVSHCPRDL